MMEISNVFIVFTFQHNGLGHLGSHVNDFLFETAGILHNLFRPPSDVLDEPEVKSLDPINFDNGRQVIKGMYPNILFRLVLVILRMTAENPDGIFKFQDLFINGLGSLFENFSGTFPCVLVSIVTVQPVKT